MFGRFIASFGGAVDIDEQAPFEVKRISLSGMLVDTEWAPRRHEVIPFEAQLGDFRFTGHGRAAFIEAYDGDEGTQRFRLGLEFTLLSERARHRLEEYISCLIGVDAEEASAG